MQSCSASAVSSSSQMSQFLSFSGANPSQQVHSSLGPLSSSTAQSGPAFFIISDPQASTSYHQDSDPQGFSDPNYPPEACPHQLKALPQEYRRMLEYITDFFPSG